LKIDLFYPFPYMVEVCTWNYETPRIFNNFG